MKHLVRIIIISVFVGFLTSCGVGSYTVSSGKADKAGICFVAPKKYDIRVEVDGKTYDIQTIKHKTYHRNRNIRKTALMTISVSPGKHTVKAWSDNGEIYSRTIFVSTDETKIIEL